MKETIPGERQKYTPPLFHGHTLLGMHPNLLVCIALTLLTLLVFWPVTTQDFTNYDDNEYVTENSEIQDGLSLKGIIRAFHGFVSGNWHPLTLLSHMLDCQLFGLDPGKHHLTSLLFHLANTLLLFFLLKRMTNAFWKSAFVAALFSIHPLHIESVAWVAERKDVLSTFFWMLTLWSYVRYAERSTSIRYFLTLFFFALGLMAKPMLVTLPFVLLLLDYWPLNRFQSRGNDIKQLVLEKIPLFTLSMAFCVVTLLSQKAAGAVAPLTSFPLKIRLYNALISYLAYIEKTVWPFDLSVLYPHPRSLPEWQVGGAFILLASISTILIRLAKDYPWLAVGCLWYIGTLVPVIGLVQVGDQAMADRYTYVPLIGIFIILAWGASEIAPRWNIKAPVLTSLSVLFLVILSIIAHQQVRYWANSITLFEHALKVTPRNHTAHHNLGSALAKQGNITEAIGHYYEALRLYPNFAEAHCSLGVLLTDKGEMIPALNHFYEALRINRNYAEAHSNLGFALAKQGRLSEALKHYSEALRLNPKYAQAHNNIGSVYVQQGKITKAIEHFSKAIQLRPQNAKSHYNMGIATSKLGNNTEAIKHYAESLRLNPEDSEAHNHIAVILSSQQNYNEAINHYREALRLNPDNAPAHNNLGIALFLKGNIQGAIIHFQKALVIRPDLTSATHNLGRALTVKEKKKTEGSEDIENGNESYNIP